MAPFTSIFALPLHDPAIEQRIAVLGIILQGMIKLGDRVIRSPI